MESEKPAAFDFERLSLASEACDSYFCPHIGLFSDRSTAMGYPSRSNRCYAEEPDAGIDLEVQRVLCLSEEFTTCPVFRRASVSVANDAAVPPHVGILRRIFRPRNVAAAVFLLLVVLATIIWWPPPGMGILENTAFGSATQVTEEMVPELETGLPLASPDVSERVLSREAEQTLSAGVNADVMEAEQETAVLESSAGTDSMTQLTADVVKAAAQGEFEADSMAALDTASLPDLYRAMQVDTERSERDDGGFSPLGYQDETVSIPMLSGELADSDDLYVYAAPTVDEAQRIALSRFEPVNSLGRDGSGSWLKIQTASGIEGWIPTKRTAISGWAQTLPVIEEESAAQALATSLPSFVRATAGPDGLVLYAAPHDGFAQLATAQAGLEISVLGRWRHKPWVRVRLDDGTEGWAEAGSIIDDH